MDRKRTLSAVCAMALSAACGGPDRAAVAPAVSATDAGAAAQPCIPFAGMWRLQPLGEGLRAYGGTAQLSLGDGTVLVLDVRATFGGVHTTGAAAHGPTRYALAVPGTMAPLLFLEGNANIVSSTFPKGRFVDSMEITGPGGAWGSLHAGGTLHVEEGYVLESVLVGTLCLDGE